MDRLRAVQRLVDNHEAVTKFAARGCGQQGSPPVNAPLSDPNARPGMNHLHAVDAGQLAKQPLSWFTHFASAFDSVSAPMSFAMHFAFGFNCSFQTSCLNQFAIQSLSTNKLLETVLLRTYCRLCSALSSFTTLATSGDNPDIVQLILPELD